MPENTLYYGDNLKVLREHVADESVDLVYLDPPFNSNADYNVLFSEKDGTQAASQIKAFGDTWHWDQSAAMAFQEVVEAGGKASQVMQAFRMFLGENDLLAYLAMMAPRLVELRRALKATGSICLHCDPTASHYLKLLMDAIFGAENFLNEIVWKRTSAHSGAVRYGPVHDIILFYSKGPTYKWNEQHQPYDQSYLDEFYTHVDPDGRRWRRSDLTGNGIRTGESGETWNDIDVTAKGRHWAVPSLADDLLGIAGLTSHAKLDALNKAGFIHWPKKDGGIPMFKRYADVMPGVPLQDVWTDISPLHNLAGERLGYPTQKPEALLERIIGSSSGKDDIVLDPFCGCGTAITAAQKLNRRWIGIDITHLAISLIKHRLFTAFGEKIDKTYKVVGEPEDVSGAAQLAEDDKYQFQWWALSLVHARPVQSDQKKGADKGIDGRLYFHDEGPTKTKQVIFSVKAGHLKAEHVRDLRGVLEREKAQIGVLLTLEEPTQLMRTEAASAGFYTSPAWKQNYLRMQIVTVGELLAGKSVAMPPVHVVNATFKDAPKAKGKATTDIPLFGDEPM